MFNLIALSLSTVIAICFSYFVYTRLWDIGRKEKTYCVLIFGVTLMLLVFAWGYGINQGLFSSPLNV